VNPTLIKSLARAQKQTPVQLELSLEAYLQFLRARSFDSSGGQLFSVAFLSAPFLFAVF